jgi:hypothetical protein
LVSASVWVFGSSALANSASAACASGSLNRVWSPVAAVPIGAVRFESSQLSYWKYGVGPTLPQRMVAWNEPVL